MASGRAWIISCGTRAASFKLPSRDKNTQEECYHERGQRSLSYHSSHDVDPLSLRLIRLQGMFDVLRNRLDRLGSFLNGRSVPNVLFAHRRYLRSVSRELFAYRFLPRCIEPKGLLISKGYVSDLRTYPVGSLTSGRAGNLEEQDALPRRSHAGGA